MKLGLSTSLTPAKLARLEENAKRQVKGAVKEAMVEAAVSLKAAGRAHIASKLKVRRKSALNAWSTRVLPERNDSKPAAVVAKLSQDWMTMHERGGTVAARGFMIIWFAGVRKMKAETLRQKVAAGELAIKRDPAGQRLYIYRAGKTKTGRDRKPRLLGMLVRRATLKRRLDVGSVVSRERATVARQLEAAVDAALEKPLL